MVNAVSAKDYQSQGAKALGEKIRTIRQAECLSRGAFGAMLGIPVGTLRRYETGKIISVGGDALLKIVNHPLFYKYALWLMTDTTSEAAGQVAPSLNFDEGDTNEH
ncbi:TPA: transcriptional regulator [Klebsiella aerogenes]|nr:transcriptional regulator [Klebsiella aerogenes]